MYLFCTTRHGVSGKELQRQLGVTYKTAYRIGQQIRDLMSKAQGFGALLVGHIELYEAYVGGRRSGKRGRGAAGKTIVMGHGPATSRPRRRGITITILKNAVAVCITLLHDDAKLEGAAAMSAKFRITINLEPSEYAAFQRLATGAERSMAWLGRKAICDLIDQHERAEAPLLACLSDTNGISGRRAQ